MKHLALFNGIGGFQLAAQWVGWENVAHVEIDEWCNRVIAKHFPNSICHTDIKNFDGTEYTGTIDIITGGFPCQPFSVAGQRKGKEDSRHLWPEMFRVITEVRPTWIVGENVTGIIGLALEQVLSDLESAGYNTETFIIPACAVGALHKRDRLWIVAYTNGKRWKDEQEKNGSLLCDRKWNGETSQQKRNELECRTIKHGAILSEETKERWGVIPDTDCTRLEEYQLQHSDLFERPSRNRTPIKDFWEAEPELGRVAHGIPDRVDRLRALGNAIVPQVALEIFRAINKTLVV